MKWKFAAKFIATILAFMNWGDSVPQKDGKLELTEEDKKKLQSALKDDKKDPDGSKGLRNVVEAIEKDLAANARDEEALKKELRDALSEGTNLSEEDIDKVLKNEDVDMDLKEFVRVVKSELKNQTQTIEKLLREDEPDTSELINELKNKVVKHSKTHLFGSAKAYDAFEGRPWNQRAAGLVNAATTFTDSTTVEKLNGDLDLYFRENPEEIKSLHRDNFGLPSFWPKRINVDDRVADGTIAVAEITQARKLPWLPKNKELIKAEEGRVFPVNIDIEYVGFYLQKIEASWLNKMNKEGSQPYKESFVRFLVSELDKKARVEDRISTIKGVYVETPENATKPGKSINRQDGLLYQIYKAQKITKKYKAFSLGVPTVTNIVDYVDNMIESLPQEVRVMPGLVYYLSPYWLKAYKRRYEQLHGTQNDYTGYPTNPKDYNNIKFEPLSDLEGHDVQFVTFDDNIEILENVPQEKSMYHFEYLKRIIYIWADYKQGVRLIHIGNKIKDGDPLEFKIQTIWSNDVPIFKGDFAIPLFDDTTGEIDAKFSHMKVDDAWDTDITKINNAVAGQLIKLQGNTAMANAKNVTSADNIGLTGGNFNLKTGGTLVLFVKADGSIVELSRTAAPEAAGDETVQFDGNSVDASLGSEFYSTVGVNTNFAEILNGVEGQEISIYGPEGATTLTINDVVGNLEVTAEAILATENDFVKFVKVDGVWYESERTIA